MSQKTLKKETQIILPERPYKKIAITFIFLTALLALMVVYFSLSKATITLVPNEMLTAKEFSVKIPIGTATSSPALLTATVEEQELDIVQSYDVENFKTEEGKARGTVTIINKNNQSQVLIATTRFLSPDGLLFRLTNQVSIPAGGETAVEIQADEIGSKYDIGPAHFSIPGLSASLQQKIYGITKEPMTGGLRRIGTLTSDEIIKAQKKNIESLDKQVAQKLNLESNDEKIVLTEKEIISEDTSNKEGDEIEKFTITLKVKVKTITINKEKLLSWAKEQYKKDLDDTNEIINYDLDKFAYSLEDIASTFITMQTFLPAYVLGTLDIANFDKKKLYGLDEDGLKTFFVQYDNVKEVEVQFWPFWVRSVPSMQDHIDIRIK
ncbi:MAG: baseplate J/gp47 family protein [Patescibacteria group bacterium]